MEGGQLEGIRNKLRDELWEHGMSLDSVRAPGVISNMKGKKKRKSRPRQQLSETGVNVHFYSRAKYTGHSTRSYRGLRSVTYSRCVSPEVGASRVCAKLGCRLKLLSSHFCYLQIQGNCLCVLALKKKETGTVTVFWYLLIFEISYTAKCNHIYHPISLSSSSLPRISSWHIFLPTSYLFFLNSLSLISVVHMYIVCVCVWVMH